MNNLTKFILSFIGGAAVGAGIATIIFKNKEKKKIIKEQMAEDFDMPEPINDDEEEYAPDIIPDEKPPIDVVYHKLASVYKDGVLEEDYREEKKGGEDTMSSISVPYLISGTEFEDNEYDYEQVSLTLYSDGILADDEGNIVYDEDIDEVVGKENLNHFGDDPDDPDTIYVRNDTEKRDYEVCQSLETYEDMVMS